MAANSLQDGDIAEEAMEKAEFSALCDMREEERYRVLLSEILLAPADEPEVKAAG